jgi:hypothetical protein
LVGVTRLIKVCRVLPVSLHELTCPLVTVSPSFEEGGPLTKRALRLDYGARSRRMLNADGVDEAAGWRASDAG